MSGILRGFRDKTAKKLLKQSALDSLHNGGHRGRKTVMIAIPMHKTPEPKMIINLDNVIDDFSAYGTGHSIAKFYQFGARVEEAQGNALKFAMEQIDNCVGVLFWEDDMAVPWHRENRFNPILRLIGHDKDIVGAFYVKRSKADPVPVIAAEDARGLPTKFNDLALVSEGALFQCPYIGTGFTYVSRRAILRMAEVHGDDFSKFFEPESEIFWKKEVADRLEVFLIGGPSPTEILTWIRAEQRRDAWLKQDYAFCARAREAGLEVWVDPSFDAQHIGSWGYDRRDWIAARQEAAERAEG